MFNAAEANLKWIAPFHSKGCPPIKDGLKMVHSPYYVNHMGITLPSGAFCMIPTAPVFDKNNHFGRRQIKKTHKIATASKPLLFDVVYIKLDSFSSSSQRANDILLGWKRYIVFNS